jgi:hypothetical protein
MIVVAGGGGVSLLGVLEERIKRPRRGRDQATQIETWVRKIILELKRTRTMGDIRT